MVQTNEPIGNQVDVEQCKVQTHTCHHCHVEVPVDKESFFKHCDEGCYLELQIKHKLTDKQMAIEKEFEPYKICTICGLGAMDLKCFDTLGPDHEKYCEKRQDVFDALNLSDAQTTEDKINKMDLSMMCKTRVRSEALFFQTRQRNDCLL